MSNQVPTSCDRRNHHVMVISVMLLVMGRGMRFFPCLLIKEVVAGLQAGYDDAGREVQ